MMSALLMLVCTLQPTIILEPMNLTVYRHLSIPWLVMRDGLQFMPEGSGKFEVVGHAGTVRRRW